MNGFSVHPRCSLAMAQSLDHRNCQPGQPRPVTHNNHPRQRLLARRVCPSVERAHARDEDVRITAAVRMIHSDEFPAAPLSPVRPHAVPTNAASSNGYWPTTRPSLYRDCQ
jgi:hypothetical protein